MNRIGTIHWGRITNLTFHDRIVLLSPPLTRRVLLEGTRTCFSLDVPYTLTAADPAGLKLKETESRLKKAIGDQFLKKGIDFTESDISCQNIFDTDIFHRFKWVEYTIYDLTKKQEQQVTNWAHAEGKAISQTKVATHP